MNSVWKSTEITKRNILVTGGGGFLGSAIVKLLVHKGNIVYSFSRGYYPELSALGVEQLRGDIVNENQVFSACKGRDIVFHVAAKAGIWGKYKDYHRTNVIGTQHVISACRSNAVPFLVYTSSPAVVFNGKDVEGITESAPYSNQFHAHYAKTKALAEQAVVKASGKGLCTIILRPHLIWGPGDTHLVPRIISRAQSLLKVGAGKNLVDTTYIDNAAEAHILAADQLMKNPALSGRIYFISQGEPVLLWEMINHILKAAGLAPVTRSISPSVAWWTGLILETLYGILGISREPKMTRFLSEELATSHWFDISAARRDLGYSPKISINEGLERLEAWLKTSESIKASSRLE